MLALMVFPTFQIDSHIRRPVNSAVVKMMLVCLKGRMADIFIKYYLNGPWFLLRWR